MAKRAKDDDRFDIGTELFFTQSNHTVAGDGIYIGHVPGELALLVLTNEDLADMVIDAKDCTPTGRQDAKLGHALREGFLAKHPGKVR